ncbi:MAG: Transcriptional repressor PagR [Bacteroidetes bacterium ADurb.Bin408]|mgnify:FL=1|nr:helix-turn-helix transcriptional regulator [Bacteroidales bacterium]OPZ95610.1 MAG: Transcriptional repressor PagR [Bacteroidetes bacterium ADurb.Bin408]HNZ43440.1 metalloregulator ArsR/SmtB family transcription factor [Bacteroidales bacterium]HPI29766.1 metalloregulator ArsR/SmtB family transcription factor [Bacteroidales bacterium]
MLKIEKINLEKLDNAADKLRSLAHPMRVEIIQMLHTHKKMNVTEIYKKLKIEQASASHHLNILKIRGILESRRSGKKTYYSIREDAVARIIECIELCS